MFLIFVRIQRTTRLRSLGWHRGWRRLCSAGVRAGTSRPSIRSAWPHSHTPRWQGDTLTFVSSSNRLGCGRRNHMANGLGLPPHLLARCLSLSLPRRRCRHGPRDTSSSKQLAVVPFLYRRCHTLLWACGTATNAWSSRCAGRCRYPRAHLARARSDRHPKGRSSGVLRGVCPSAMGRGSGDVSVHTGGLVSGWWWVRVDGSRG